MSWITDKVAIAGGGISPQSWAEVAGWGITAVVNLRAEQQDAFAAPLPYAYLWLPVVDQSLPAPHQLLLGAQFVYAAVQSGQSVLIHCKMGIHRSATVAAAYLVYTGLTCEQAIQQITAKGPRLYGTEAEIVVLAQFAELQKK